jgi:drug/metabolite transporter (DMT)-like permease
MGFYRLSFSMVFFTVPIIIGGYKGFKSFTKKDCLFCALAGLFLTGNFFFWFTAIKYTNIASASVLSALHPLIVLFVTVAFMRQKVSFKAVIGILTALMGGAVIAGFDYSIAGSFSGNAAAFLGGACFGGYFLVGRFMRRKIPTVNYIFLVFSSCWLFFTIAMLLTRTPFFGYSASDYFWLLMMALVCQVGAHSLYNWCVGYVSSLYVSAWASLDLVFCVIFGAVVFREFPEAWQYIGGIVAIFGLLYYTYNSQEKRLEESV